ncbi:MAG: 1-deoxy-D-xylulose-5-phosphate synthase [Trichlorobacter sp.]|nr:1-deoxy-D-xylulose-5-phosphate synthase [Trichlorobacter sp.]
MSLLAQINSPDDLKKLPASSLAALAAEIRTLIIDTCAKNGGHLAPSLGVVELTLALHLVLESPYDKLIWDVGHQAYAHKIICGRRDSFHTLRTLGGISGFPKRKESVHDIWEVGHSSTSLSAATGFAVSRDITKRDNKVVAVIGDGSITSGMAFEALNHAGALNPDLIVILNDNEMSIAENVGALSGFLTRTSSSEFLHKIKHETEGFIKGIDSHMGRNLLKLARKAEKSLKGLFTPSMLFQAFGFEYIGPIDGHDLPLLTSTLKRVKKLNNAVLVHVLTTKGKGYKPAEQNPALFHGVGAFDKETGKVLKAKGAAASYTSVFGSTISRLAEEDERIVAITAAMPDGTGLTPFAAKYPQRFFDVGIAEQHGVTFAAGLAAEGKKPVFAVYSSFLQRAYDEVLHDVCLQNLPVVFALDRGGVVGSDGPTHHGVFDLSYLRHIPNMTLMAPKDENELQHMLKTAVNHDGPVALRYPRGSGYGVPLEQDLRCLPIGKAELLRSGTDCLVLAVGSMVIPAMEAAELLAGQGINLTVVNVRFVKPLDEKLILELCKNHKKVVTAEENALQGGFGSAVLELLADNNLYDHVVLRLGYPDDYIEQGEQHELRARCGLDSDGIAASISGFLEEKEQ